MDNIIEYLIWSLILIAFSYFIFYNYSNPKQIKNIEYVKSKQIECKSINWDFSFWTDIALFTDENIFWTRCNSF